MTKGLLSCIIFLLLACGDLFDNENHYNALDDRYKIKFSIGDTLMYQNELGHVFQLKVTKIEMDQHAVSRGGGGKAPFTFTERQTVKYDSLFKKPVSPSARQRVIFTIVPQGRVEWQDKLYGGINLLDKNARLATKEINHIVFNSVYKFDSEKIATANDEDIIIWYYNYEYGFVGFELKNKQVYGLIF